MNLGENENTLSIDKMNKLGHLDRLFDVAEDRANSGVIENDAVEVAVFGIGDDGNYSVVHPDTVEAAYTISPRLFHGFLTLRYTQMGNVSAHVPGRRYSLQEYLEICKRITERGLNGTEDNQLNCEWIVKKSGGLHKAVLLGSGYTITDEQGDINPLITWMVMRFSPDKRRPR